MNHAHCGCQLDHDHALNGLGAGARGPTKAQLEEQLARDIARRIQAAVPANHPFPWAVVITGGRKTLAIKQAAGGQMLVQCVTNSIFMHAPEDVRADVAHYFVAVLTRNWGSSRESVKRIDAWQKAWHDSESANAHFAKKRSYETRRADGLDLNDLYQRLVATHIHGTHFEREADWSVPRLTWGKRAKPKTNMQLGLYTRADKTITVHGNLQDPRWPGYLIAHTIWHEMVHYWQDASGRKLSHDNEFRNAEKLFSGDAMANAWLKRNGDFVWGRSEHVT